jgi:hypothetical protein
LIIMIGATGITLAGGDAMAALIPAVVGLLATIVAWGRWRLAPHAGAGRPGPTISTRP